MGVASANNRVDSFDRLTGLPFSGNKNQSDRVKNIENVNFRDEERRDKSSPDKELSEEEKREPAE